MLRVLHDMSRAQVVESLIAAVLLAVPFVLYFWSMTS